MSSKKLLASALLVMLCATLGFHTATHAAPNRLVLAFYYPWFDQNIWNDPVVSDHPPDRYTSSDANVMARQIAQARGANIDAFVSAWYGPQTQANQTETNLRTLFSLAQPRDFKIAVGFETTGPFFHSQADVSNALSYLLHEHATKPAYLKWNGKPVIFFWAQDIFSRAAWQTIRNQVDPNHTSLWIAEGFDMSLQGVFDGDYLYNVAWATDDTGAAQRQWASHVRAQGGLWVGTVMPGWDDTRLAERPKRYKRDRQNGEWYKAAWAGAVSANPDWIVITSWNEFVENTYIEPSANLGSQYLDLTRALAANWKASAPAIHVAGAPAALPTIAPTPQATPTPAPKPTARPPTPTAAPPARATECSETVWELCLSR